jgi:3-oxoadipate enol-lactonase
MACDLRSGAFTVPSMTLAHEVTGSGPAVLLLHSMLNVKTWVGPAAGESARESVRVQERHAFEVQLAAEDPPPILIDWDLAAITARTLVVSGDLDLPDFTEIAASLTERMRSARWERLDWAGHLPSVEDPGRFNPLLLEFLAGSATG